MISTEPSMPMPVFCPSRQLPDAFEEGITEYYCGYIIAHRLLRSAVAPALQALNDAHYQHHKHEHVRHSTAPLGWCFDVSEEWEHEDKWITIECPVGEDFTIRVKVTG